MLLHRRRLLVSSASLLMALAAPAIRAQTRPTIRIGLGPQQPTQADTRRVWEPVYRIIADRVGADLHLNVANDWAGIATALANEQIDVAQMGPWGYILAKANGGARIINMMLVDGKPYYKAIIVGRPSLSVARFPEDARGLSLQLMDRGATSGWLVPMHLFRTKGIDPRTYFSRFVEGGNATAMQLAVANGQVDLAAGWDTHRNTMILTGNLRPDQNQIVWESEPIPNECVVVRRGLPDDLRRRIQIAVASLSEEERRLLPPPYTGFIETSHQPYEALEQMGRDLGVLRTGS